MKRWEPIAYPGPDNVHGAATHRNFNQATGERGSWPDGLGYQQFIDELCNAIEAGGFVLDGGSAIQLAHLIQSGGLNYAVATGTANAWVVAPALSVPAYKTGRVLNVIAPATNTTTTVVMNVSERGDRPIKKANGSDPAPGDLVGGVPYPTFDDGTNIRVLAFLPSDLALQKSPFNVQQVSFTARASLSGTGFVSYQAGTYVKKSATSNIVVATSFNLYSTFGAGATTLRLGGFGAGHLDILTRNMSPTEAAPAGNGSRVFAVLPAGPIAWTMSLGRDDATNWQSWINPNSTDAAFLPSVTTTTLLIQEIEP